MNDVYVCTEEIWETPVSSLPEIGLISLDFDHATRALTAVLSDRVVGTAPGIKTGNADVDAVFSGARSVSNGNKRWRVYFEYTLGIKISDDFFEGEETHRLFDGFAPTTILIGANWLKEFHALSCTYKLDRVYTLYCDLTIQVISPIAPIFERMDA